MNDVVILQKKLNMMRSTIANDVSTIVGTDMLKLVDKSFETATAQTNMGEKWQNRHAFGGEKNIKYPILQWSGKLRHSFKFRMTKSGRYNRLLAIGTNLGYAKIHNEGLSNTHVAFRKSPRDLYKGKRKYSGAVLPRPFLTFGLKARESTYLTIDRYFKTKFGLL